MIPNPFPNPFRKRLANAAPSSWTLVPASPRDLEATVRHCRKLVNKRAAVAAGAAAVPIPGLDWITDVATLLKLIPEINAAFGLTPQQVERLAPDRKVAVLKAISAGGSMLVGRLVTRDLIVSTLRTIGVRLTSKQAAKFVPIAGQAVSAAITYASLRYVCEQHIQQCADVARRLMLPAASEAVDVETRT
jgi:uncharacterized protein (DUF697 family)